MAEIIGGITTSHIPAIGRAIAEGQQEAPYWKPFFDGFPPVHAWLEDKKPDVAIVVYNDHGLNFFQDNLPTFALGMAPYYQNEDEGWGLKPLAPFPGHPELSAHIANSLVEDEFDISICQEMAVDHGFTVPMSLLWPERWQPEIKTIPLMVNVVQHPMPTPARCLKLGQALGHAVASFPDNLKVVVLGTGGMSHQLDGQRAGFINRDFDLKCMEQIVEAPEKLAELSNLDLVREAGSQGPELILWLVMRGALGTKVKKLHSNYHAPVSNTGSGLLLLEPS